MAVMGLAGCESKMGKRYPSVFRSFARGNSGISGTPNEETNVFRMCRRDQCVFFIEGFYWFKFYIAKVNIFLK
jgi:hypothetical protein